MGLVTLSTRLGLAGGSLTLDLASPPPPGPLLARAGALFGTVLRWVSAVDAACGDD
jgi:hypothetical protein